MVTRALPATDEGIVASLKTVATAIHPSDEWHGPNTVLTNTVFDGLVRYANQHWFTVEEKGFEWVGGLTTLGGFIKQLRKHEANLVAM